MPGLSKLTPGNSPRQIEVLGRASATDGGEGGEAGLLGDFGDRDAVLEGDAAAEGVYSTAVYLRRTGKSAPASRAIASRISRMKVVRAMTSPP
jgi:hypothetical protein